MGHPNEELLRKGYDAFAAGDLAALDELFADDIVWHASGDNILSGDYEGKEAVFGLFGRIFELSNGTFRNTVHDAFANDDHGVAIVQAHVEHDGRTFDGPAAHVFHLHDGKVTEFWGLIYDAAGADELWGRGPDAAA